MRTADVGDDIGDPTLERVLRFLAGWGVPALVTGAWLFLALTSEASTLGKALMGLGLAIVLALWWMIRMMMLHAALSRAVAVGNADRVLELAADQLRRRRRVARGPFLVYVALAHELRGEWAETLAALDKAEATSGARLAANWRVIAAGARIGALVETGDAATARAVFERVLRPLDGRVTGDTLFLYVLADGRVRRAEGDLDGAAQQFDRLLNDIRISSNVRALAHRYAARCALARGDAAAADRHIAQAIATAPETWAAIA